MNLKTRLFRSLIARVTMFTLAIVMISLWSLSFYFSKVLHEHMQQQLSRQQYSVTSTIANTIDDHIKSRVKSIQLVAAQIGTQKLVNRTTLDTLLSSYPVLQNEFNGGAYILDAKGKVIAGKLNEVASLGINSIPWERIIKEAHYAIGSPVISKQLSASLFAIGTPILDTKRQVIGVLVGVTVTKDDEILNTLIQSHYGQSGRYLLIDRQDRLIINAITDEHVMQTLPPRGKILAIDRFIDGFEGTQIYVNPMGTELLTSVKQLKAVDWAVATVIPTKEIFAPIHALQKQIILATLMLIIMTGLIVWWVLKNQLSPILDTVNLLADLEDKDTFTQPLPIKHLDEIGVLIGAFNRLLGILGLREAELKKQNKLFSAFIDALPNPIFVKDKNAVFIACNSAYEQSFGISREDFVGKTVLDLEYLPIADREIFQAEDLKLIQERGQTKEEIEISFADGIHRTALYQRSTFDLGNIQGGGMLGLIVDISQRKVIEDQERFRNKILEMLAGGEALNNILRHIVLGIEALHPDMICSILLLDEDGKHLGRGIAPSLPDFYNAAINGIAIGVGVGSCGTAAFTAERVIVEDIATHPYWANYKELAAKAGLGACWSQPIRGAENHILGTIDIYHRELHKPTADDIVLIERSARLASVAIDKCMTEAHLRDSRVFTQGVLDSVHNHIAVINEDGVIVMTNKAWKRFALENSLEPGVMLASTVVGANYLKMCNADGAPAVENGINLRDAIQDVLHQNIQTFSVEYSCHSELEQRWFLMNVTPLDTDKKGAVIVHTNITERKLAEEQIRKLAYYDSLTQLPNRRMLNERLAQAIAASDRSGMSGALIVLDLDNFKLLNDTYGHGVGDKLLIEVAKRLTMNVREIDTVARFGGDEFVVVLASLDLDIEKSEEQAKIISEKLRIALTRPYFLQATPEEELFSVIEYSCSSSIGVTLFSGKAISQNQILKQADDAMYHAKESVENSIHFFSSAS